MTEDDIKRVVYQVLVQAREGEEERIEKEILKCISVILTGFGIHDDERREITEDFHYLRRWRKGSERISTAGFIALITLFISGIASALWLGIKTAIGK